MGQCINIKHPDFKKLQAESGLDSLRLSAKMGVWMDDNFSDEWPTLEQLGINPNQVNYELKSAQILLTDKAKQIFDKGKKVGWDLNKILTELQVPKEQKDLILGLGIKDREEILMELASNYSFAVEVNIAKGNNEDGDDYEARVVAEEHYGLTPNTVEFSNKVDELMSFYKKGQEPSHYYSNLTVPGGTNYTENEISTPLITPNIKGHAQFSTDQGIGWFRSDEQGVNQNVREGVIDGEFPENFDFKYFKIGNDKYTIFNGKTLKNNIEINKDEYIKIANSFRVKPIKTKTCRVLEVQSDLFQKGRDNTQLTKETGLETIDYDDGRSLPSPIYGNIKGNSFLQLLNKDNNWVTFFIKSIIQDSAKKGYEKVLFPKGETAAKVEGHQTIADEIIRINDTIQEIKDAIENPEPYYTADVDLNDYGEEVVYEFYAYGSFIHTDKEEFIKLLEKELIKEEEQKQNLKSQGIEKLKPIEAFYEIKIGNVLEKIFGKENVKTIKDEYGNEWREININKERDLSNFALKQKKVAKESYAKRHQDALDHYGDDIKDNNNVLTWQLEKKYSLLHDKKPFRQDPGKKFKTKVYKTLSDTIATKRRIRILRENPELVQLGLQVQKIQYNGAYKVVPFFPMDKIAELDNMVSSEQKETFKTPAEEQTKIENAVSKLKGAVKKSGYTSYPHVKAISLLKDLLENVKDLSPELAQIVEVIVESEGRGNATKVVLTDDQFNFLTTDTVMSFDPARGVIFINNKLINSADRYRNFEDFANTFVHELVHTLTIRGLREDKVFHAKINKLFKQLKKDRPTNLSAEFDYAFKNVEEFVAELFINPTLIKYINEFDKKNPKPILQQILDWIFHYITGKHLFNGLYDTLTNDILTFISTETKFTTDLGVAAAKRVDFSDRKKTIKEFQELEEKIKEAKKNSKFTSPSGMMKLHHFGYSEYSDDEAKLKRGQDLGSVMHNTIQSIVDNITVGIKNDTGITLSKEARKDIETIIDSFKGKGVTMLSEVHVADFENKIAGRIDLLIIDAKGDVHIYDFKTKENGFKNYKKPWLREGAPTNPNDPDFRIPYSDKEYAHLELSAYARLLQRSMGIVVKSMNVVMLKPEIVDNEIQHVTLDKTITNTGIDTFNGQSRDLNVIVPMSTIKRGILDDTREEEDKARQEEEDKLNESEKRPSKLEEISDKILEALEHKRTILGKVSYTQQQRIETFLSKLNHEQDINKRMILIIKQARKSTAERWAEYKRFKKEKKQITREQLIKWRDYVSAFDALDEYANYLEIVGEELKDEKKDYKKELDIAIKNKNSLKELYKIYGVEMMVDALTPYYHRVHASRLLQLKKTYKKLSGKEKDEKTEKEWLDDMMTKETKNLEAETRELIRKEIVRASKDVNFITRFFDNILDSRDVIVAAMINKFAQTHEQSRIDRLNKKAELLGIVEELEAFQKNGVFSNLINYYDFMIERDKEGNPTGHYTKKHSSQLMKDWKNLGELLSQYDNDKDAKLVRLLKKAWKDGFVELTRDDDLEIVKAELKKQEDLLKSGKESLLDPRRLHKLTEEEKQKIDKFEIIKQFTNMGNAKLRKTEFALAINEYIKEIRAQGLITESDYTSIIYNNDKDPRERLDMEELVDQGIISETTEELISNWIQDNTWDYRDAAPKYVNPQWEALSKILENKDDPRSKFYNYIVKMNKEADRKMAYRDRLDSRLPGVVKTLTERLTEGQSPLTIFANSADHALTLTEQDIDRSGLSQVKDEQGNIKHFLPTHYTAKTDIKDQSFDIPTIYLKYWDMANDHFIKSQILPEMEMAQFFLDERETVTGINKRNEVLTKRNSRIAEQYRDFMLMAVYGEYKAEGGKFKLGNKVFSVDKILDLINSYSSLNLLGLNFIQGFANILLGETLQTIETIAHEYVSPKSYNQARAIYDKNLPFILGDIAKGKRVPENKVSLVLEEFGTLQEKGETRFRENTTFAQLMKTNTLFFTSQAGEHFMQTRFLLAMLVEQRMYNKKGEDIGSAYDFYVKDEKTGRLVFDPEGKVDKKKSKWEAKDIAQLKIKIAGIVSRIHGEYGELGMVAVQRYALGRMAYTFRKFIIPGFKRRFETYGYSERLGQFTEGAYVSTWNFFSNLAKDGKIMQLTLWGENWNDLTDMERANIVRTGMEFAFLMLSIMLIVVLTKMEGDDDDELEKLRYFMLYQMYRYANELTFYVWPPSLINIMRSPMASLSVFENGSEFMAELLRGIDGFDVYEKGPNKGHYKVVKEFKDMVPGIRQFYRVKTLSNTVNWFKN